MLRRYFDMKNNSAKKCNFYQNQVLSEVTRYNFLSTPEIFCFLKVQAYCLTEYFFNLFYSFQIYCSQWRTRRKMAECKIRFLLGRPPANTLTGILRAPYYRLQLLTLKVFLILWHNIVWRCICSINQNQIVTYLLSARSWESPEKRGMSSH